MPRHGNPVTTVVEGDIYMFQDRLGDHKKALIDWTSTIKFGIVKTVSLSDDVADPHWGGVGTTDLSIDQVATGTAYVSGGPTLVTGVSTSTGPPLEEWVTLATFTINQDAGGGFNDGSYGIIYLGDAGNQKALGLFVPNIGVGVLMDNKADSLQFVSNPNGLLRDTWTTTPSP